MSHTPNTKNGAIRTLKLKVSRQWPQAASLKRAGGPAGIKHQASKKKLDKSSGLGYCRISEDSKKRSPMSSSSGAFVCFSPRVQPIRGGTKNLAEAAKAVAATRTMDQEPQVPSLKLRSSFVESTKHQAPPDKRRKPQAPSYKPQA